MGKKETLVYVGKLQHDEKIRIAVAVTCQRHCCLKRGYAGAAGAAGPSTYRPMQAPNDLLTY